jgi:hypothetical protein
MAQSPRHAWAIMDTPMTAPMEVADPYYRDGDKVVRDRVVELLNNSPFIRKADTLAELARRMEVDVPTFLATVERYNKACEQRLETEPEFGKPLKSSKAFDTPPYYAIQIFPLARKNFGGVKTDLKCRVLDKHFEPIAGLYAAGEVAGMAGGTSTGVLVSKAPCWVQRFSAGASPAAGLRKRRARAAASSASRTGVEWFASLQTSISASLRTSIFATPRQRAQHYGDYLKLKGGRRPKRPESKHCVLDQPGAHRRPAVSSRLETVSVEHTTMSA